MVHGRVKSQHFQDLVEKVQQRLSSWRGRLLNKAGRLTLVNSVLTSIPTYNMHIQWLPNQVSEKLDMLARRFLWSGQDKRGLHLVKWETITQRR
uniref:Ribonuclease H protein At1g65750 family n=1 Tax=Cajanus cajan TaxID=3821 RepID=A0A151RQ67_CAJCA|nr:Putative ribonuclease H protein At1g65750 family [Cajanus cajan]